MSPSSTRWRPMAGGPTRIRLECGRARRRTRRSKSFSHRISVRERDVTHMGIRESLKEKPILGWVMAALLLMGAGALAVQQFRGGRQGPVDQAYFTVDEGN